MGKVDEYYRRDVDSTWVDHDILLAQLSETIRNEKHIDRFRSLVADALASSSSSPNVRAIILLAKQQECGDRLSQALVMGSDKVDELVEELRHLRSLTSLDDLLDKGLEVYSDIDVEALVTRVSDQSNIIKVYPRSLYERLDGGASRQHHLVYFGPVEVGKTAAVITASCGFAREGHKVVYFINEDPADSIIMRHISNLSGMTKHEIYGNPKRARDLAHDNGFGNIVVISCSPGNMKQIEHHVEKEQPVVIIGDQLRNFEVKADTRVNQLEAAATGIRNITKKHGVLGLSVTQAGDSAKDKLALATGDVDFSNVGIPAQADVMVGIGMNAMHEAENLRQFSLPKNKLSGIHEDWPVRINPQLSRITSV